MTRRILCTFPGRHGDLLWALPTVRAIAEATGGPVDLLICGEFANLVPLLELQPYLARVVADPAWGIGYGWQPPNREDVISPYDATYHLGYRRWPELPLPLEIDQTVRADIELPPLDLTRPWITLPPINWTWRLDVTFGFSDCWFELKHGLVELVLGERVTSEDGEEIQRGGSLTQTDEDFRSNGLFPAGSRWETEAGYQPQTWVEAARLIRHGQVFLGDCSALHVLAVALGIPVVLVEPLEARWNPIFYPCGMDGPQVTMVRGLDGRPSFDARHVGEALDRALEAH